ncbi:hypothetical protein HD806DRAFT_522010 [Xylariaceae sp. AK1471]|nr:hypothetical protein HD806DRAFT_522010 [Xylariaceae sp. AK1471]
MEWIPKSKQHKEKLEGMEDALHDLTNRDQVSVRLERLMKCCSHHKQVFIIDNSASMKPHWEDVKQTTHALSYIVKSIDPDGFDIRMTNSSGSSGSIRKKKCEGLFDDHGFLEDHRPGPNHGPCRMEKVLSDILPSVISKAAKPSSKFNRLLSREVRGINVYILTNGVWEGNATAGCADEAGGVENAIETTVKLLRDLNLSRVFLSIQFVRFGEDPDGERRMRWLDDGIKGRTGGWDIVDTTHHSGSVWKMIIGATSAFEDNVEDRPSPVPDSKASQSGTKRAKLSLKSR